jgi:hypothetical protein
MIPKVNVYIPRINFANSGIDWQLWLFPNYSVVFYRLNSSYDFLMWSIEHRHESMNAIPCFVYNVEKAVIML